MPSRSALNTFVSSAQERLRKPVADYYRVVDTFGRDSIQTTVAQSLTKAEMERVLRSIHTQAAVLGSAGQMDADAKSILQDIIGQDAGYLNRFMGDLPKLTQGQAISRADMYVGTAKGTVSDIATLGLPTLPIYPRDSRLDCQWHCKCATDVRYLFGEGNFDVYWMLDQRGGVEHCPSCIRLGATWRPLRIREGKIVGTKAVSEHDIAHLQRALKNVTLKEFDPSQAREENGEWTDGGGSISGIGGDGGVTGPKPSKPKTEWERTVSNLTPEQRQRVAASLGIKLPGNDKPARVAPAPAIPRTVAHQQSQAQVKKLTPDEVHGVKNYTSNMQYEAINSSLRKSSSLKKLPAGLQN